MENFSRDPLNPFPWYEAMRKHRPVFYDEQNGIWHVFRYGDVKKVLSDYTSFSSSAGRVESSSNPIGASIISTDPPRHTQLRSLVNKAFTPRRVQELAPRIRAISEELVEKLVRDGRGDLVEDYSGPLPVIVIAELLGIPPGDRRKFKKWSDDLISGTSEGMDETSEDYFNPQVAMAKYFSGIISLKRENPGDDLISSLLEAEVDGEKLSEFDLLGFCVLLLVAGNETTANLITNAVLALSEHEEQYQRVIRDPSLIPGMLEEALRFRSPVQSMFRTCVRDTELGGKVIHRGEPVLAWIGSANHDDGEFTQAGEFMIDRNPNRHIAFGEGVHFCLGAPLARLEARIALETLVEKAGKLAVMKDAKLEPLNGVIVYGLKHLPVIIS